jgi:hypothetical protein
MLAKAAHPMARIRNMRQGSEHFVWNVRGTASVKTQYDAYRQEQQQQEARDDSRGRKSEGVFSDAKCLIELNRIPLREKSGGSGQPQRTMLETPTWQQVITITGGFPPQNRCPQH